MLAQLPVSRALHPQTAPALQGQLGKASWRSGYVADCKSAHPGSIPGEASNFSQEIQCAATRISRETRPARLWYWDKSWDSGRVLFTRVWDEFATTYERRLTLERGLDKFGHRERINCN